MILLRKSRFIPGVDPGRILRRFDLNIVPYLLCVFGQTGMSKRCRSRSDAAERGVWSGSTLFATHPAILHTFLGSEMDLLTRSTRKSVPNLSNVSYISYENKFFSQTEARLNPPPPPPPPKKKQNKKKTKKKKPLNPPLSTRWALFFYQNDWRFSFLQENVSSRKHTYIILTPLNPTFI